jgi:hypothetical protein
MLDQEYWDARRDDNPHDDEPTGSDPDGCCGCGKPLNTSGGCDDCISTEENAWHVREEADQAARSSLHFTHGHLHQ